MLLIVKEKINKFICASCKKEYEEAWSEKEAEAEYEALFPEERANNAERAVICDDCHKALMKFLGRESEFDAN